MCTSESNHCYHLDLPCSYSWLHPDLDLQLIDLKWEAASAGRREPATSPCSPATQTYLSWVSALVWSCQEPVQHSRPETLTKSDEFSLSLAPWESALPWSNEWHRRRSAPWQWGVGSCQRGCNNWTSFVKNMVSKFHKLLMIELHTLQWCMSQE